MRAGFETPNGPIGGHVEPSRRLVERAFNMVTVTGEQNKSRTGRTSAQLDNAVRACDLTGLGIAAVVPLTRRRNAIAGPWLQLWLPGVNL